MTAHSVQTSSFESSLLSQMGTAHLGKVTLVTLCETLFCDGFHHGCAKAATVAISLVLFKIYTKYIHKQSGICFHMMTPIFHSELYLLNKCATPNFSDNPRTAFQQTVCVKCCFVFQKLHNLRCHVFEIAAACLHLATGLVN